MIILNLELFIQQTKKWLHTSIIIMEKPTEDDLWVLMNVLMKLIYFHWTGCMGSSLFKASFTRGVTREESPEK